MQSLGFGEILKRHRVEFSRCSSCGFVQTEKPYWLDEAYSDATSRLDTSGVSRNLEMSSVVQTVITLLFNRRASFVDYGGSTGLFVRLMRDRGFDFYWEDKYAHNIYARGFEADPSKRYELASAFEVFEHFENPMEDILRILKMAGSVVFSVELLPEPAPLPEKWWYYGLAHGQHLSFYTQKSLSHIAAQSGLNYFTDGRSLHLITPIQNAGSRLKWATNKKIQKLIHLLYRNPSLAYSDHIKLQSM